MLRHLRSLLPVFGLSLLVLGCEDRSAENPPIDPDKTPADAAPAEVKPFAGKTLNIFTWSEYIDPEIVTQFEQLTGATVKIDTYEDSESMSAKMAQQGKQYDVLVASDYKVPELAELKQIQPIDRAKVPNAKNLSERFQKPPYDPEGKWSLAYQWGTVGIMYRKDKLADPDPAKVSWKLIFDPAQQPGPFVLIDEPRDCFAAALKSLGYSINTTDPAQIKEAGDLILKAKATDKWIGFAGGSNEGPSQVAGGAAAMAIVYSGDAFKRMAEDENLDYAVPVEGAEIWTDAMLLPAGAEDVDLAYRFMDYILDPQIGAQLSNWNQYGTPNQAALQYIDPEQRANPAIYPPDESKLEALEDVGDALTIYEEVWTAIKAQ